MRKINQFREQNIKKTIFMISTSIFFGCFPFLISQAKETTPFSNGAMKKTKTLPSEDLDSSSDGLSKKHKHLALLPDLDQSLFDMDDLESYQFKDEEKPILPSPDQHLVLGNMTKWLNERGLNLTLDWVTETAGLVNGGRRHGVDFTQQVALIADMDWEKIAGIKGFSTHAIVIHRSGRNASWDFAGDPVMQAQEVAGSGYARIARLYALYMEEHLWNDRVEVKMGRLSPGMDYANSPYFCQFMSLSMCGHPRSFTSQQSIADWPGSVWGGRILVRPTKNTFAQIGGYESKPWPPNGPSGWEWGTGETTGTTIPLEIGYAPTIGKNSLIGHYHVVASYDTSKYASFYSQVNASSRYKKQSRTQFVVMVDQMVWRHDNIIDHGLVLMANWGHNTPQISSIKDLYSFGIIDKGFWRSRFNDQITIGFSYYTVPHNLTKAQEYQFDNNSYTQWMPGNDTFIGGGKGIQTNAMIFELGYGYVVCDGLMLQPVFEYFYRPGATTRYDNATFLGLKTHVMF